MTQILFRDCTLLDTAAGELKPGHHVRVEDERIVFTVPRREMRPRPG